MADPHPLMQIEAQAKEPVQLTTHSPGIWSVVDRMSCGEGWAVVSDHDFPGRPPTVHKRYMAQIIGSIEDARLISAAPEMLEALEALAQQAVEMRDRLETVFDAENDAIKSAFAAIAKARGRT